MHNKKRFFIELPIKAGISRREEADIRRAQAYQFVDQLTQWLQQQELDGKVASMAITALGQVQITCETDIISRMRDDDSLHIAMIRQGASLADSVYRIGSR